jgi:4-aminobutyrate aminotransferase-like enzyme
MDRKTIRSKHEEFLFPCVTNYYEEPVVLTKGQGSYVTDVDGREYQDFFGGILTVSLGHCDAGVVEAVQQQAATLGHVSTLYPTENLVKVAERLAKIAPGDLKKTYFTSSGTEADETAIMLAKIHTGKHELIVLRHGYSGRSLLAVNITGQAPWRLIQSQVPGIKHAMSPYCYRCPMGLEYPSCDIRCATDIEELIRTETCGAPGAFLAEPIQGVGGFVTPPKEYFQVAVGIVRKYGGLFICDEVQTGFGRTGGKWFGIEHWGVEPDIMTMAKGIANGFPVGATIAKAAIADSWKGPTIATFGGNPISMAAADATLKKMEEENIPARAEKLGGILKGRLMELKETYPFIGDVRGMGLMLALELVDDRKTKQPSPGKTNQLMEAAKREGLLIANTLRIAPPMLSTETDIRDGADKLGRALASIK